MTNRKTCSDLVEERMKDRAQDFKFWMEFGPEARIEDGEGSNLEEYGLGFDRVSAYTFDDQPEAYYRYQLSWGGPSDEVRFFRDRIEYWYLDWFDGAKVDVTHEPWAAWLLDVFECEPCWMDGEDGFNILEESLPTDECPAEACDFMLMDERDGRLAFKHRDSRNYIFVLKDGSIHVPKRDEPFMRGEF